MASFGDLSSPSGLSSLNDHLSTRSYISGYQPSASDVQVAYQIRLADADSSKYPHVRRWLTHILSLDGHQQLAKQEVAASAAATTTTAAAQPKQAAAPASSSYRLDVSDSDSDFNLSDDDEGGDATAAILAKKQAEAAAAKKNKPAARSSIIWDIKPEDDETDMNQVEAGVRAIKMDGLEWQAGERVPVAYGIEKLRIISQVVDDLVPTDDLQELLEQVPGVQSTDIFAFNKV